MAELNVDSRVEEGVVIVSTDGYINNTAADSIAKVCVAHLESGERRFVLNLEGSRIINSIGISILIEVIEQVREQGGKVAFCQATPTIEKTFKIMGLLNTSSVHERESDARAFLLS